MPIGYQWRVIGPTSGETGQSEAVLTPRRRPSASVHTVKSTMCIILCPVTDPAELGSSRLRTPYIRSAVLHPETSPDSLHVTHVSRRFRKPLMSCRLYSGVDYAACNVWSHIPVSEG